MRRDSPCHFPAPASAPGALSTLQRRQAPVGDGRGALRAGCPIPLSCIFNALLLAGSSPFLSFYLNILIMVMFIKRALTFWGYIIKYLWFEWQDVWDLLANSPESGQQQAERSKSGREFVTSESGGRLSGESPHSAFTFSRRI